MKVSLKEFIVIHIAYRQIFSAPVRIEDCRRWSKSKFKDLTDFDETVNELITEGSISQEDGYLCMKGEEHIIGEQPGKDQLTQKLIKRGKRGLLYLAKLPFIKYIGISGSVAASNPIGTKDGDQPGFVDLDLFVICRSNCLWILFLIERVIKNIRSLYSKNHFFCFNYATDESFLEIYNKNFYTATEITNLKTLYDDNIYEDFLYANQWYEKYYPKIERVADRKFEKGILSWTMLLAPLNFAFFTIFCMGRAVKRWEAAPLLEIFGGFNPVQKCNLKRISNPNGGFQEAIKNRFDMIMRDHFPGYVNNEIMEDLFPKAHAFSYSPEHNIHDREHADMFTKYTLDTDEKNSI